MYQESVSEVEFETGAGREKNMAEEDNVTLFEVVRQGKMAMTAIVDDWIEAYKADRQEAVLDLIQFFINASGCKGVVTQAMIHDASEGFQDVIKRMTEQFDEDSGDYPLVASGAQFKKFRSNFGDFVQALVRQCQYQIIYDQYMMDNILTLLTELSNSQVRAFRHTSTLAAMKLMTALVNVALQLSVSIDNTQRQYDAERGKTANRRANEKLDMLLQKRKDLEEQQSEIETMLNGIFKGIFVHRYRDYIADIRGLCMEEIGVWMKMFPKVFLTDSYLKYVGWTLHDKQKEVRQKCLQTLMGLYKDDEMTKDLKLFTSRFKDRIVSMTLDKDYDVAVCAIKLILLVINNCGYDNPVLSSNDCESVYQLVYCSHRPVAVSAAEFLHQQLLQNKESAPLYTKRGRRRSQNAQVITTLVLFFIECELHEHATYLVDSLWDSAGTILKDWECMTDLLLEEPANDQDALDERQESALIDIMVCSVRQASEGIPAGRQGHSKKAALRDKRVTIEDRMNFTTHFITALPQLLSKYQVDKEKVILLLEIPQYYDLEIYTTSRLERQAEILLSEISNVFSKHTDSDVLSYASQTFHTLCDSNFTICNKAVVSRRSLVDSWVEQFNLALNILKDARNEADAEEVYNVAQSLKRLACLYGHNDLHSWELFQQVFSLFDLYKDRSIIVNEEVLQSALKFCFYDITYEIYRLKTSKPGSGTSNPHQSLFALRQRTSKLLKVAQNLLNNSYTKVQEVAFGLICDLLLICGPQLVITDEKFKPLIQRSNDDLSNDLAEFVQEYVFRQEPNDTDEDDTARIAALHQRRSLLGGFSKLLVYNLINMNYAAVVFQQYIRFYNDFGDIVKETISRLRHIDRMQCAQTLALSLMTLYKQTVREQGGTLDQGSAEYTHMKELARRFALTFGLDAVKTRDAVADLHKKGIIFAFKREDDSSDEEAPSNLSFLNILIEFSAKLMKQDRKTVVQYLDTHTNDQMLRSQSEAWIPLVTYRNNLLHGIEDDGAANKPGRGRRARKKRITEDHQAPATPLRSPGVMNSPGNATPKRARMERNSMDSFSVFSPHGVNPQMSGINPYQVPQGFNVDHSTHQQQMGIPQQQYMPGYHQQY